MNDILEKSAIYGTVKVGEREQVVLPSMARNEFHIRHGDLLLVVRSTNTRGISTIQGGICRRVYGKSNEGNGNPRKL